MEKIKRIIVVVLTLVSAICVRSEGLRWLESVHDFGAFSEDDDKISAYFQFVNETDKDVMITQVASTCGCTVPDYDREAIAPGDTATIQVTYNPAGRPGRFSKQVFVRTTAEHGRHELRIKGIVIGNDKSIKNRYPVEMGPLKLRTGAAMMGKVHPGEGKTEYVDGYNQSADTMRLRFTEVPEYLTVGTVPEAVAPGDMVNINFYFRGDKCKQWGVVTDSVKVWPTSGDESYYLPVVAIMEEDFSKLTVKELAKAPSLSLVGDRIDLGTVDAASSAKAIGKMQILNKGNNELKVRRVYSQDPAVSAKASKDAIKKGKTADIIVEYDASKHTGNEVINTKIILITNDPVTPTRTIRVVGQCK